MISLKLFIRLSISIRELKVLLAVKKGVTWILENRSSGWTTTRDTLYASWAIGEAGKILWKAQLTDIIVSINDEVHKKFHYNPEADPIQALDTLYQMREIYLDNFKKQGSYKLSVTSSNLETNVAFEIKKYYDRERGKEEVAPTTSIECNWPSKNLKVGQTTKITVNVKPHVSTVNALMVEIPVPAGFLYDINSITSDLTWRCEYNPKSKYIACFISQLSHSSNLTVPLTAKLPGAVISNPCRAFEMYRPSGAAFSTLQRITISS